MTDPTFSVLLSRTDQTQPDKLTQILAKFHNVPPIDARLMAKRSWGFLGERLEESRARLLVTHATEAGVGALLLRSDEVAALPEAQNARSARCVDEAFFYATGSNPEEHRLAWADLKLVCAVGLKEETLTKKKVEEGPSNQERLLRAGLTLATGIPMGAGKKKIVEKTVRSSEFYLYMDLFALPAGAAPLRLSIDAEGFNFAYLGAKKLPNVMGNFRFLAADVTRLATAAIRNKGVEAMLANQPFTLVGYDTAKDYEKEAQWLLTLAKAKA